MFISKFELNIYDEEVCKALNDAEYMHKYVWSFFNYVSDFAVSRENLGILYRVVNTNYDPKVYLIINSEMKPNNIPASAHTLYSITDEVQIKKLKLYPMVKFNIIVNPIVKENGKRRYINKLSDRYDWMNNKAKNSGFKIHTIKELDSYPVTVSKKNNNFCFMASEMTGVLEITDFEKFYKNVKSGVGPEKAYGTGMFLFGV